MPLTQATRSLPSGIKFVDMLSNLGSAFRHRLRAFRKALRRIAKLLDGSILSLKLVINKSYLSGRGDHPRQ